VERNSNRSLAFASAAGEDTRAPFKTAENRVGFVIAFAGRRCQAPMACLKIARSFNCELGSKIISSPSGAAENFDGLEVILSANPAVETAGYFRSPLGG
jgi:hypothetical protein